MLRPFEIHEPATAAEASRLLACYGDQAAIYAGGTELLPLMKEGLSHFPHLVNLKTAAGLDAITGNGTVLRLGALATHRQIERSPVVAARAPLLAQVASQVANIRVRTTGTLGGNLCFAEPHSDPAPVLVAMEATLVLARGDGERHLAAGDFFTGILQTARLPDEVLIRIEVPILPDRTGASYQRFALHERPTAGVAAVVAVQDETITAARIAISSVGPAPCRLPEAEAALVGRPAADAVFQEAAAIAAREADVLEDLYGSVEYKRHIVGVLARRALAEAAARARSGAH